jgi:hypothetical protein
MSVEGTPIFNAIAILEIEAINWGSGQPALVAHSAFINTKNGATYGRTTIRSAWSRETLEALEALRASMEQDVANVVFEGGSSSSPTRGPKPKLPPGGIGEELADEAPQV